MAELDIADEIRCVQLLDASRRAGLEPIQFGHLHAFAYLTEALSPVWGVESSAGDVLKREGLPFFPRLQFALDRLVWRGLVEIDDFGYWQDDNDGRWQLQATCHLDRSRATDLINRIQSFDEEAERSDLYLEIALGLAQSDDIAGVFFEDASYSDPGTSINRLIEFTPRSFGNLSARVADHFSELIDPAHSLASGERIGLYMAHLRRKASKIA